MKYFALTMVTLFFLLSITLSTACNQSVNSSEPQKELPTERNDTPRIENQPKEQVTEPIVTEDTVKKPIEGNLESLRKFDGKYPREVKFLDHTLIRDRLKKLMGKRFDFMDETWAVETPIKINNNILVASACEAHNCGNTNFIVAIDLTKNRMYAGVREEKQVKTYSEEGENKFPQPVKDWIEEE